ncbi:MAG TPA: DUF4037 domain-containing protein [Streptosporangiaceae bacterium]|nr:DUF4037 domain-containing protein [Streptosporangiaceae bacterium]
MTGDTGLAGASGADVARLFHAEAVAPILAREFPRLRYAAGRLGSGSDVLGLDDAMSRDHDWGCRLTLLVDQADAAAVPAGRDRLAAQLPDSWRGRPVRFATSWDHSEVHRVEVATVGDFARSRLGIDPLGPLAAVDWLMLTGQGVLEVTAGPVFIDQTTELRPVREVLRWYPAEVDRYLLAAGWLLVSFRLPMHGRAADRGDEAGSRVIAGAISGGLLRLALLVHRRWAPYEKWLGTAVRGLPDGAALTGFLTAATSAPDRGSREEAMAAAAEIILDVQRDRGVPVPRPAFNQYWDRPYPHVNPSVIRSLQAGIKDPDLTRLPAELGSIEQWCGDVELLARPSRRIALAAAYRAWLQAT